jgi:hypothetical protein
LGPNDWYKIEHPRRKNKEKTPQRREKKEKKKKEAQSKNRETKISSKSIHFHEKKRGDQSFPLCPLKQFYDILAFRQLKEKLGHLGQLLVTLIIKPCWARKGVFGLEHVRCGWVVNKHHCPRISAQATQVLEKEGKFSKKTKTKKSHKKDGKKRKSHLDIVALVIIAGFPEESMLDNLVDIKLV